MAFKNLLNRRLRAMVPYIAATTETAIREQVVDEILIILDADPVISSYPLYTSTYRNQIDNKRNIP